MSAKVLYCTAGPIATAAELLEIADIEAIAAPPYEVMVMSGAPKVSITGLTFSAATDNSISDAGATITASTISASATDNSLNDSGSGFLAAGFLPGDLITISGFTGDTDNNTENEAVISTVTAAKMVLKGVTLVTDAAGESVTVSSGGRFLRRGFRVGQDVMVRGFTTSANNISTGIITALTATKMTIGGTDGDGLTTEVAGDTVTICTVANDATYGGAVIHADYIAGTVPEKYKSNGTAIYTVFDPANPPDVPALVETQAVVSNGETVTLLTNAGGTSDDTTATVSAHACTVALPATKTVVENGDTTTVSSKSVSLAVSTGALGVATFAAATDAAVSNGDTITVDGKTVTLTVSGRSCATGTIVGTQKIVANGDTVAGVTGSGTTATLTVTGGVLSIALS